MAKAVTVMLATLRVSSRLASSLRKECAMGNDTGVREVLSALQTEQWRKEFTSIQKAREHDLTGKSDVEFSKILEANFKHYKALASDLAGIGAEMLKLLGDPDLKDVQGNPDDVMIGVKTKDEEGAESSMQFMGASAARLKVPNPPTGKAPKPLSPPQSQGLHEAVATLPENVVGNDQLAASRSRIEAQLNALPTNIDHIPLSAEPGGVNFITANQTVIRLHIAECYPNIPPGLGDYITGQVIHARSLRPKKDDKTQTPVPVPRKGDDMFLDMDLSQQAAFQKKWTDRLKKIDGELLTKWARKNPSAVAPNPRGVAVVFYSGRPRTPECRHG